MERLNVGLVGAAGRGGTFRAALEANGARIHAVCDVHNDSLDRCAQAMGATEKYTDYETMLEESDLDAVVIGTPQHLHVPQSVMALERNLHVLSEVPAAIALDQALQLVQACYHSRGLYMMAENYIYRRDVVLVKSLAEKGVLGELYYAEGEYLHDVTGLAEHTLWRRYWQLGIDGVTYPTHSLGPVLQWMAGDRVARVACEGTGRRRRDPRGELYHQDSAVMLCKTESDALVKIRTDLVSPRPHAMHNHFLQGTTGVFESGRAAGEKSRLWFKELSDEVKWFEVEDLLQREEFTRQYLPEIWRNPPPEALGAGHGGGDFFEVRDFVRAVRGEAPCPIGVHEALDMTLPGLISQQSIQQGGAWIDVPDSRTWVNDAAGQLQMLYPQNRPAPTVDAPSGYQLRLYRESDEPAYIKLMDLAGFKGWNRPRIAGMVSRILPGGFFVIEHVATGAIVATVMATHNPSALHPYGAEMGWVAGDPEHAGVGLGRAICAAAVRRLREAGYRRIYLLTDDFRLPALKVYLTLGFEPFYYRDGMKERWDRVRAQLAERSVSLAPQTAADQESQTDRRGEGAED